jgi:hypothetical protein
MADEHPIVSTLYEVTLEGGRKEYVVADAERIQHVATAYPIDRETARKAEEISIKRVSPSVFIDKKTLERLAIAAGITK